MSREDVVSRLGRLLAVIPWVASQPGGATVEEIAAAFSVPVNRIEKDLRQLEEVEPVAHANVLMYEEDGYWVVDVNTNLATPLRLTKADAFALTAAGALLLQMPGVGTSEALVSAIGKVAKAIGGQVDGTHVQLPKPDELDTLHQALEQRRAVEIEYYSASRDDVTTRVVAPLKIFTVDGWWHLVAWCRTAEGERDFRIDRVRAARVLDDTYEWREPTMRTDIAFDAEAAEATPVRIEVQPEQRWAVERYPVREVVDLDTGATQFTVDAAGDAWLERLLLRLGPTARVVEPAGATVGREVAQRLLAMYR